MNRDLTEEEVRLLHNLLLRAKLSHETFIDWALSQCRRAESPDWIERSSKTATNREVQEILEGTFSIEEPSLATIISEVAFNYLNGNASALETLNRLLDCLPGNLSAEHIEKLYILDDNFSWKDDANMIAQTTLDSLLPQYAEFYAQFVRQFSDA